jgi:hypothetical protein
MRSFLSKGSVQLGAGDAEVVDLLQKLLVYVGPVRSFVCVCHPTHHAYNKWTGGMGLLMCAELFKHAVVCDGPSDTTIMTAFLRRRRWLTHTSTSEQARHGAAPSPHPLPTHHPNRSRCEWKITYIWKLEESTRTFT